MRLAPTPTRMANPPINSVRMPFFRILMPKSIALITPRRKSALKESATETGRAALDSMIKYGKSVTRPVRKYEVNIMMLSAADGRIETSLRVKYSCADCSESKLPTAIEKASTKRRIMPVRTICDRSTPPTAMPERSPTVDTRLSSTPKTKFLIYAAFFSVFFFTLFCQTRCGGYGVTFIGKTHENDAAGCTAQAWDRGDREFDDLAFG